MPHLPVGWTVTNQAGPQAGPARQPSPDFNSDDSNSDNDQQQNLDIAPDSPGWEDVEAEETEDLQVKCLLCSKTLPEAREMLSHCAEAHDLDFLAIVKREGLDFYGMIKLVNYIRSSAKAGSETADTSNIDLWKDDKFLQPVLEEDALLFSLDDLVEEAGEGNGNGKVPDYDEVEAARVALERKTGLEGVPE